MSTCKKAGFSLSELLVALALLLIVAALLAPALGRTRYRTQLLECLQRQKQVGMALILYAADHGGAFPPFVQGGEVMSSTGTQNTLANHLVPPKGRYLPDADFFLDPGAVDRLYRRNAKGWADWTNGQANRSGYAHVYMSPRSHINPQRAAEEEFGANDTTRCPPHRVMMYCYYTSAGTEAGAHTRGEVNVLRLDGSVHTFTRNEYQPGKDIRTNFGHKRS